MIVLKQLFYSMAVFLGLSLSANADFYPKWRSIPFLDDDTLPILLYHHPQAMGVAVLFAGGNGYLGLSRAGEITRLQHNFLIRSREAFYRQGLHVVLVDAPQSRATPRGLLGGYRNSREYRLALRELVSFLNDGLGPVWLIGTSRGSTSAAAGAIELGDAIAGVVLTAPVTRQNSKGLALAELPLSAIKAPVLLISHQGDQCKITPAKDIPRLAKQLTGASRLEASIVTKAAKPTKGRVCGGRSAHGFYGLEHQVVYQIADFLRRHSPR